MTGVLIYLLFSAIALGLVGLTGVYQKWGIYKKEAVRLSLSAENGVRAAFNALSAAWKARTAPLLLGEVRFEELKAATADGLDDLAEEALELALPVAIEETADLQSWRASIGLSPVRTRDLGCFLRTIFRGAADSRGKSSASARFRDASLEIEMEVAAGRIPLAYLPLLVAGEGASSNMAGLIENGKLALASSEGRAAPPPAMSADEPLVSRDASPLLREGLKLKVFSPDKLSRAELRSALGLPMVDEPVPEGVYLIVNDTGLGGLFVQGDVEEMALAIEGGYQHIQLRLASGTWRLRFSPSESRTEFEAPTESFAYDRTPLPIVLVNGDISSLGGGLLAGDGSIVISAEPVPCVLDGVSLTIVSAGETVLTSHLVGEGVRWTDGIPYLKESRAQVVVYASGADLVDGTARSGRIRVDARAPRDLQVQGSLTASDGLLIEGDGGSVSVAGGVQTSALDLGENRMRVFTDDRIRSGRLEPGPGPLSSRPLLWILRLEPLQWTAW